MLSICRQAGISSRIFSSSQYPCPLPEQEEKDLRVKLMMLLRILAIGKGKQDLFFVMCLREELPCTKQNEAIDEV